MPQVSCGIPFSVTNLRYKSTLQIATQGFVMNELPCFLSVLFVTVQILF